MADTHPLASAALHSVAVEACGRLEIPPWAEVLATDPFGDTRPVQQWEVVAEQMRRHAVFEMMRAELVEQRSSAVPLNMGQPDA